MTLAFNKRVQEMLGNLEGNLHDISDELKTRFQRLRATQLGLARRPYSDGNNSAYTKANSNDMKSYINETLPGRSGRRHVKEIVDDIHTNRKLQTYYEDYVGDSKIVYKNKLRFESGSQRQSPKSAMEKPDKTSDTSKKVGPPVPPRTARTFKTDSANKPYREFRPELKSTLNDKPKLDLPYCRFPVQSIRQRFSVKSIKDDQVKNVQTRESYVSNINVRIGRRNYRSPSLVRDRVMDYTETRSKFSKKVDKTALKEIPTGEGFVSATQSPKITVHKTTNTKAAERWKKIRDLLKSGKLFAEIRMATKHSQKVELEERRRIRRRQSSMKRETVSKDIQKAQTPTSVKSSKRWQTLRDYVKSGRFVAKRTISNGSSQKCTVSECKRLLTPMSDTSKIDKELQYGSKMKQGNKNTVEKSESPEASKGFRENSRSDQKFLITEASSTSSVVFVTTNTPSEKWKSLREHLKSGKIFLKNAGKDEPTKKNQDLLTSTTKTTTVKWKKFRERMQSRRALLENDIISALKLGPKWAPNVRNTASESDLGREHAEWTQERTGTSLVPDLMSIASLPKINGLVVSMAKLVEKSATGNVSHELWNDLHSELTDVKGNIGRCLSTTKYFDTTVEMERAEATLTDKLKRIVSAEEYRAFSLDYAIEQLKATTVANYAAGCDQPVLVELRELLTHLYSLSSVLSDSFSRMPNEQKDTQPNDHSTEDTNEDVHVVDKAPALIETDFSMERDTTQANVETNEDESHIEGTNNGSPRENDDDQSDNSYESTHEDDGQNEQEQPEQADMEESQRIGLHLGMELDIIDNAEEDEEVNEVNDDEDKLQLKQKLYITCLTEDELDVPPVRQPWCRRSLVRALIWMIVLGFFFSLVLTSEFGEHVLTAWLYYWALMSCNVRLTHSSSHPVV